MEKVPFSSSITRDVEIEANFFKVNVTSKDVDLRKYRIQLGQINGKEIIKPEVKRALIDKFLRTQWPPARMFVSNYFSTVISIGRLHGEFGDHEQDGDSYYVQHRRTARPGEENQTPELKTVIWYEGSVNMGQLLSYIQAPQSYPSYLPDEDLKILNAVSWRNINDSLHFGGGRVGKKFYPGPFPDAIRLAKNSPLVYAISTGFFTSMRPGTNSILLNANPTTSAFSPSVVLQDWIDARWGLTNGVPPDGEQHELKQVRVTFQGDREDPKTGKRKQRRIFDFGESKVSGVTFTKKGENKLTNVLVYMKARKSNLIISNHFKFTDGNLISEYPRLTFNGDACCVNLVNAANKNGILQTSSTSWSGKWSERR